MSIYPKRVTKCEVQKITKSSKNINIRIAKEDELEEIIRVNRLSWKTTYKGIIEQKFLDDLPLTMSKEKLTEIKTEIKNNKRKYIVALYNKKIIGMLLYLGANYEENNNVARIQAIYILEEYQKQGIGKKMFDFAKEKMRKEKYTEIIIGCIEKNPSNEFYKKLGGEFVGKESIKINGKDYKENIYKYYL